MPRRPTWQRLHLHPAPGSLLVGTCDVRPPRWQGWNRPWRRGPRSVRAWHSGETGASTRTVSAARRLSAGNRTKEMRNPPPPKPKFSTGGDRIWSTATDSGRRRPFPAGDLPTTKIHGSRWWGEREREKRKRGMGRAPRSQATDDRSIFKHK